MRVDLDDIPDRVTLALVVSGAGISFFPPMTTWAALAVIACLLALGWIGGRANRKLRQIEADERDRAQRETREFQETLIPKIMEEMRRQGFTKPEQEKVKDIITTSIPRLVITTAQTIIPVRPITEQDLRSSKDD